MAIRGIRGAITVERDESSLILAATRELLSRIIECNPDLRTCDIACVFFSATEDLVSEYPALAARQMGWTDVPLMCNREIPVPHSLPRCIRTMIFWNTEILQIDVRHVYLREAVSLRLDLDIPGSTSD
jgi:chorismate mutase